MHRRPRTAIVQALAQQLGAGIAEVSIDTGMTVSVTRVRPGKAPLAA